MNNLGQQFLLTFSRLIFSRGLSKHRSPTFSYSDTAPLHRLPQPCVIFSCRAFRVQCKHSGLSSWLLQRNKNTGMCYSILRVMQLCLYWNLLQYCRTDKNKFQDPHMISIFLCRWGLSYLSYAVGEISTNFQSKLKPSGTEGKKKKKSMFSDQQL